MAEQTGIHETPPARPPGNRPTGGGMNPKQKRLIYIGGAGLAGVLLLSRKGSTAAAAPAPQQQLTDPGFSTGGFTPTDTSGGAGSGGGGGGADPGAGAGAAGSGGASNGTAPTDPVAPVNVNPDTGAFSPSQGATDFLAGSAAGVAAYTAGEQNALKIKGNAAPTHPKQPPKKKPPKKPPAKGKGKGKGKTHKSSDVESVHGAGSGITVNGRTFPGATGHVMHAPDSAGNRRVSVQYGSHVDNHIVHANGKAWTDHAAGSNPPSRSHNAHPAAARRHR